MEEVTMEMKEKLRDVIDTVYMSCCNLTGHCQTVAANHEEQKSAAEEQKSAGHTHSTASTSTNNSTAPAVVGN